MQYNVEMFDKIVEHIKQEFGYDLTKHSTEFYIWCELMLANKELDGVVPSDNYSQLGAVIHTIQNVYLQSTSEMNITLSDIIDYVVDYYDDIMERDMSSNDILKAILNDYEEMEDEL